MEVGVFDSSLTLSSELVEGNEKSESLCFKMELQELFGGGLSFISVV
jgi:hypothetical protein